MGSNEVLCITIGTPRLGKSAQVSFLLWAVFLVVGHLSVTSLLHTGAGRIVMALLVSAGAASLWAARQLLYRWLTSPAFAVSLLMMIALATALGTVVVQGASEAEMTDRYGAFLTALLGRVDAQDIFHSAAFRGFLALLAFCLVLVTVKRRPWRILDWGFLLSHGGVVIVLVGGLVGSVAGTKGFIDFREGQTVRTARPMRGGEASVPMGFALRLDRFEIERHPPEYRLIQYDMRNGRCEPVASLPAEASPIWRPAGAKRKAFRVSAVYPDFVLKTELREVEGSAGHPVLTACIRQEGEPTRQVNLLAGVSGRDTVALHASGTVLRFVWSLEGESPPMVRRPRPARHLIAYRNGDAMSPETIEVKPGQAYPLGDGACELAVLAYYPDFAFETKDRKAFTRSSRPNNPALRVSLRGGPEREDREHWLFSKVPEYGRAHGREDQIPALRYRYEPKRDVPRREIVVVGRSREVRDYRDGILSRCAPLPSDPAEFLADSFPVTVERLHARAGEIQRPTSRSAAWRNPVVEIETDASGRGAGRFLPAGQTHAIRIPGTRSRLVFARKRDDVKAYRSRVSVLEPGGESRTATISVNRPLAHGGYRFYQSNYRAEDPTYSGLLVVRDPGLPIVYAGFLMISVGVLFLFYIRPLLLRRDGGWARAREKTARANEGIRS